MLIIMKNKQFNLYYVTEEAQLWKIDGTKLVNKKGITAIEGECKIVPHGAMFYIGKPYF